MPQQDISLVIAACDQIFSSGRKPSTATVRHTLPAGFSFPVIINGLKFWETQQKKKERLNANEKPNSSHLPDQVNNSHNNQESNQNDNASTENEGFKSLMDSLSAEGGHTSITDISSQLTTQASDPHVDNTLSQSSELAYSTVPQETLTSRNSRKPKSKYPQNHQESKLASQSHLSDEKFLQLPITEQLLHLKHLLEELNQKL